MALPAPVYRCFRRRCAAGFFEALWKAWLAVYGEATGIDWTRVSGGGCMTKAPLAQEAVGRNPAGRGKNGSKRHILVGGAGVPLALAVTRANRSDVSRLERLLDSVIIERPDIFERPQHICLDAGYAGESALEIAALQGFIPRIRGRGRERAEKTHNPAFKARPPGGRGGAFADEPVPQDTGPV